MVNERYKWSSLQTLLVPEFGGYIPSHVACFVPVQNSQHRTSTHADTIHANATQVIIVEQQDAWDSTTQRWFGLGNLHIMRLVNS